MVVGSNPTRPTPRCLSSLNQMGTVIPKAVAVPPLRRGEGNGELTAYTDGRNSKTNPPPVGIQKTSRARNPKTQRSGNAEVGSTFEDTVQYARCRRDRYAERKPET